MTPQPSQIKSAATAGQPAAKAPEKPSQVPTTTKAAPASSSASTTAPALAAAAKVSETPSFSWESFDIKDTLGTGTFGRVRLVRHKATEAHYALKILKKTEIIRLKQVDHIRSEVTLLKLIKHPFVVNLMGHFQDETRLYMVLEFVRGGELFSHLRREGRFFNDHARYYAEQVLLAFAHMHEHNVVYRDLKPENLLISDTGTIKITDFGFAKQITDKTWTLCGTPEYLAPEIIQSKGHGKPVDWWALGILCFEMLAGYPPFYDENPFGIYQKILTGRIEFPRQFDARAKDFIRRLLTIDKKKRLGSYGKKSQEVKSHKWFENTDWEAVFNMTTTAPFIPAVAYEDDTTNFDPYPDSLDQEPPPLSAADKRLFLVFDTL